MAFNIVDVPRDRKIFQVMLGIMIVVGVLKSVFSIPVGTIVGIIVILIAYLGLFGSFFNHKKSLLYFMIGTGVVTLVVIAGLMYDIICMNTPDRCGKATSWDQTDRVISAFFGAISLIFLGICLYFGFMMWRS
mmetsp:Transcript_17012/g.41776  ORF Transcript_17012/g.41776 Transcript_17012/m.41776 type:complete len:133 (+) Transcript_17012:185-583(+)